MSETERGRGAPPGVHWCPNGGRLRPYTSGLCSLCHSGLDNDAVNYVRRDAPTSDESAGLPPLEKLPGKPLSEIVLDNRSSGSDYDESAGGGGMLGYVLEAKLDGAWAPSVGPLAACDVDEMVEALFTEGAEEVAIHEAYTHDGPRIRRHPTDPDE